MYRTRSAKLRVPKAKCQICKGNFTEERQLPCGHTFCAKCLLGHIRHETKSGRQLFKCPSCIKGFPLLRENTISEVQSRFPTPAEATERSRSNILSTERTHSRESSEHLECLVENYITDLRQVMKTTNENYESLRINISEMKSRVKDTTQKLILKLYHEEKKLLKELDDVLNKHAKAEGTKTAQENLEAKAVSLLEACKRAANAGRGDELTQVHRDFIQLEAEQVATFRYNNEQATINTINPWMLGQLDVKFGLDRQICEPFDIKLSSTEDITSVVKVGDVLLTVHSRDPHVYVYKAPQYKLLTMVKVPELESAGAGIVYLGTDSDSSVKLVVAEGYGSSLHFITLDRHWILQKDQHRVVRLRYRPQSITMNSNQLVVCISLGKEIYTYDKLGNETRKIALEKRNSKPLGAVNILDGYVVADMKQGKGRMITRDGRTKDLYEGTPRNPLEGPVSLTVERSSGHLLIVDYDGNKIQELDKHGTWVRNVLQHNDVIQCPRCVHVGDDGLLYTGYGYPGNWVKVTGYSQDVSQWKCHETRITTKLTLNN